MLLTAITLQTRGFDVSYYQGAVTQSTFNCLHNAGLQSSKLKLVTPSTQTLFPITKEPRLLEQRMLISISSQPPSRMLEPKSETPSKNSKMLVL
ncbi:Glycosyl_hydrolase family 25 protein [Hexamita inflata]|uniref:Glycosyl hydrolase family 25 protein n=1 Tax=Hexamita inflata TaxID=28002 RepID=A0AA86PBT5_9EUKA|nr:Glycosyl hydrolase family 25 protein [Hexamita inflata]